MDGINERNAKNKSLNTFWYVASDMVETKDKIGDETCGFYIFS